MKSINKHTTIIILILMFCHLSCFSKNNLDEIISLLDTEIENSKTYISAKEKNINKLKNELQKADNNLRKKYDLNEHIYEQYRAYICDSAISYLRSNITISVRLKDIELKNRAILKLAHLLISAGYHHSASELLHSIDHNTLSLDNKIEYYINRQHLYSELSLSTEGHIDMTDYRKMALNYEDSVLVLCEQYSLRHIWQRFLETNLRNTKNYDKALEINDARLKRVKQYSTDYALIMFERSLIYEAIGNTELEMQALAQSAISDIRSAITDHASLWKLAALLLKKGDIDHAKKYITYSWRCTNIYNAPLRNIQSAEILSVIEDSYQNKIESTNTIMKIAVAVIIIVILMLTGALWQIHKQNRCLSDAKNQVQSTNLQLTQLNNKLTQLNNELKSSNADLMSSNNIKEVYISRFIKLCSTYIDKLEKFRLTVTKNLTAGKTSELLKQVKSTDMIDREIDELNKNFDSAFLHIYPDFVEKFNELLNDDYKIEPKPHELLNTELRIFALIKLGITDGQQIADFLHYSVNTIYNYRAKVKKHAKTDKTDFEEKIRKIH